MHEFVEGVIRSVCCYAKCLVEIKDKFHRGCHCSLMVIGDKVRNGGDVRLK